MIIKLNWDTEKVKEDATVCIFLPGNMTTSAGLEPIDERYLFMHVTCINVLIR